MGMNKEPAKENNKPTAARQNFKTFMNVFRPIRLWLNTTRSTQQHKTSTPISNPILQHHHGNMNSDTLEDINDSIASGVTSNGCAIGGPNDSEASQFCRTAQARMSLPIMQQNKMRRQVYSQLQRRGQQVARSMGHIYLQHKGETKQASLPNELTTIDTIRALFVCAFPHMLTMEYMSQPHVKIYIYNPSCNIFYELCDIEDVRHESVLRIHHSDPLLQPAALPSHISMANLLTVPQHQYSTLHRLPPRLPPQFPIQNGSHSSLGQPIGPHMMHLMSQSMHHRMASTPNGLPQPPPPPISHIPPPKPRRMIPASYSMHGLSPSQ
jgi:hypothetical protein